MSILDLGQVIFGDLDKQFAWFQQNLLSLQPNCSVCGTAMVIQTQNDIQDKRLYPRQCSNTYMWAAYNNVQYLPPVVQHQMVNHSIEFVNSTTGVHTQNGHNIETE